MTIKFYLVKINDEIKGHGNVDIYNKYLSFFCKLNESNVKKAILFFNDEAAYFEKDSISVFVGTNKNNIGMAKLYAKKLINSNKTNTKLDTLDEAFKLAEKIKNMDLEEFLKFKEGGD